MQEGKYELLSDITPLFFPCLKCDCMTFHQAYKQGHGFTLFLPLTNIQLAHSHKSFFLICPRCYSLNGRLKKDDVNLLIKGFIPKGIYTAYNQIHQFYSPSSFGKTVPEFLQSFSKDQIEILKQNSKSYKLEI